VTTFGAGVSLHPTQKLTLSLDAMRTDSTAGLDPFEMVDPAYAASSTIHYLPMTRVWSYSDLDIVNTEVDVGFRYDIRGGLWIQGQYAYRDYDDRDPYLWDQDGTMNTFALQLGLTF
jgi:hypothetical protein